MILSVGNRLASQDIHSSSAFLPLLSTKSNNYLKLSRQHSNSRNLGNNQQSHEPGCGRTLSLISVFCLGFLGGWGKETTPKWIGSIPFIPFFIHINCDKIFLPFLPLYFCGLNCVCQCIFFKKSFWLLIICANPLSSNGWTTTYFVL